MENSSKKFKGSYTKLYLSDLVQHPASAWIYTARGIKPLAESIREFGGLINNPKAAKPNKDGKFSVLSGWRRVLACRMLGWDYIFVEVMEDLPEEDEALFVVECNNYREKTPREKYYEIKLYEVELPKRQGKRSDIEGGEKCDRRKVIAEKMDIAESEVRDLVTVGDHDATLLDTIDGDNVKLTPLATKVRKVIGKTPDLSKYHAVQEIVLEMCECPFCHSAETKRIDVRETESGTELFYP